MLIIKTNQPNTLVVTVSQNSELTNPEYLFSFTHIFSKQNVTFIPQDISTHKSRYDEFYFVEGTGVGQIHFPYQGEYLYAIYEQPAGSGNLNPALAYNVVENGDAQIFPASASTMDSQYDIFISNNEDNSNIIFAPDEPQPTPNITPSNTPTNTSTPTPTVTPTFTPTPSQTPIPSFTGLTFICGTGNTFTEACDNGISGNTIPVYVSYDNTTDCSGCSAGNYNCFPCVNANPQNTWWLNQSFTIPLPDLWLSNNIALSGSPEWKRQYIFNGYISGGTFTDC